MKYTKKPISSLWNHVLHGHANKFTSFLAFLEMWKTSHPDDAYELSTDDGSRNRIKADEVSVGGIFSDYLLTCHPYGDNHKKQREFEGNDVAAMAHVFTLLLFVDHDCLRKLTQDINWHIHPVGSSKLLRSFIPT